MNESKEMIFKECLLCQTSFLELKDGSLICPDCLKKGTESD